mgnify:CR=1 FL=1
MLESIFTTNNLTISNLLICSGVSLVLGFIIAIVHKITSKYSKNFLITLTVLPILVMTIIFMTNGNLGTSIAIVGAFSLVRFRSLPGTSKEIMSIFFSMTIGLAMGMGAIIFAIFMTILVSLVIIILSKTKFGEKNSNEKILKVVLPEDMDYETVFDEVFKKYLNNYKLNNVKTINMGSLFELSYTINEKNDISEKQFIDDIRVRNGNLKVSLSHNLNMEGEL